MDTNAYFVLFLVLTLGCWIALTMSPTSTLSRALVGSAAVPFFFALLMPFVMISTGVSFRNIHVGKLESLRSNLFGRDDLLLVWILQYLAFALLIGMWMSLDGARLGMPSYIMVPSLALTLYIGPLGVLVYAIARYQTRSKVLLFDTLYDEAERAELTRKDRGD